MSGGSCCRNRAQSFGSGVLFRRRPITLEITLYMKLCALIVLLGSLAGSAFAQSADSKAPSQSGIDLSAIDKSADPCVDFYQYTCGNWIKNNPIPKEESRWGRFSELHERNQRILRQIAEDAAAHTDRSALDQKVGDFYGGCMAEDHIEQLGTKPLQEELARIKAISSQKELVDEVAQLHKQQVNVFFEFGSMPDPDDAKTEMAGLTRAVSGCRKKTTTSARIPPPSNCGRNTWRTSPRCWS